jgi:hypothetical protein
VAIINQGVVRGVQLEWLKSKLWNELLHRVIFTTEGHDGVSDISRSAAKNDLKEKLKNSRMLTKKDKIELKTKSELDKHCQCNGPPSARRGGFATWGCTLSKFGTPRCKFFQPSASGRKKFHLKNRNLNDTVVEEIVQSLSDVVTDQVVRLAPIAAKYMSDEASNATCCRLGSRNKLFSAMSLNSNFRIHSHVDKRDFPNGLTALLNVNKDDEVAGQLHVLVNYALTEGGTPGIAINLGSGTLLIECAAREWHGSTKPIGQDLKVPSRVALVYFTHRNLNLPNHGAKGC